MKTSLAAATVLLLLSSVALASAKPWIQDVDLPLPREVDPENPIAAHESDCRVFYVYNYPMTCGEELVFEPGTMACVPPEQSSREECRA